MAFNDVERSELIFPWSPRPPPDFFQSQRSEGLAWSMPWPPGASAAPPVGGAGRAASAASVPGGQPCVTQRHLCAKLFQQRGPACGA